VTRCYKSKIVTVLQY